MNLLIRRTLLVFVVCQSLARSTAAQPPEEIWQRVDKIAENRPASDAWIHPKKFHAFNINHGALRALLNRASKESPYERRRPETEITLPMPDGTFARFMIVDSPVMEPELAAKFPAIHTYRGIGVDDPQATVRLDISPQGFHAQILSPRGTVYIDPYWRGDNVLHTSYYKRDYRRAVNDWNCLAKGSDSTALVAEVAGGVGIESSGSTLRTYRLACAADVEYVNFHGGTVALGLAAVVTAINRVTGVYETELAIRMVLVANNDQIIYTGNANLDPYSNSNGSLMLSQNQSNLDSVIGSANYDIGHVFSTGGGGIAGLGVVCLNGNKARGVTGSPSPIEDAFWIDYVAHEMGHEFGANHPFNGTGGNCSGGNRNGSTAYEPGSGSTIMAYAGICAADDLQPNSDPYFHSISYEEIIAYVGTVSCSVNTATGNSAPTVDAGANFTIPAQTPFILTAGSASDPDGDSLTYGWEERDLGAAQTVSAADNGASPVFRSFNPTNGPSRIFPRLQDILNNTATIGEKMFVLPRTAQFKLTVRDNRAGGGGVNSDTMTLTVVTNGGPFQVTFPNAATNLSGTATVTWNVGGTTSAPINTANVNIRLATDGGLTFSTMLVSNTPNDGAQAVALPNITTSTARIKVEATGNIFFDISNTNFTIIANAPLIAGNGATLTTESCSPANSAVDPGETVTLNFGLRNIGTVNTTNLVATLQATGGVTSPSGPQNFGSLTAGGATVTRSFSFTAAGNCGDTVAAVLTLQDGAANLGSVTNLINLGALGSPITNTYSSGGLSTAIPDASTIEVPLTITDTGIVSNVNVRIRLNHTFDGDLIIDLVAPDNTVVNLANRRGGSSNNYGSGAQSCSGTFTVFDDAAGTAISAGSAPFAGTFSPEQLLSALNGKSITGTWKLRITDAAGDDTGTLYCWQLQIARQQPICCADAPNQPPVISAASISPATPDTTQNLIASVTSSNDPDNDAITLAYQWQDSTNNVTFNNIAFTAAMLPASATVAGDFYRVIITPNDGQTNGAPFTTASVPVAHDSDADGLNDDWEIANFGSLAAQTGASDPDGDGLTNAQEFQAGTDPTLSSSALAITSIVLSGDDVLVSWSAVFGRSYMVQTNAPNGGDFTNNFADLSPSIVITGVPGTGEMVTNYLDVGGATNSPSHYYRVRLLP